RPISAWKACLWGSGFPTTASIRPTRNTSFNPSTRDSAPGRASSTPSPAEKALGKGPQRNAMSNIRFHKNDLPDLAHYTGPAVAIDTETLGLNPHRDRLCVVQL